MTERRETDQSFAEGERIAKYLASAGVASRRDVEKMIVEGRITVDGRKLDTPAFKVTGKEKILLDGQPVSRPDVTRLWRYHKPAGLVTTNKDPDGRPTIFDEMPKNFARRHNRPPDQHRGLLLLRMTASWRAGLSCPQPVSNGNTAPAPMAASNSANSTNCATALSTRARNIARSSPSSIASRVPTAGSMLRWLRARSAKCAALWKVWV
jgi:hypothetical protein